MNNIITNIIIVTNNIIFTYWSWLRLLAGGFVEDLVGGGRRPDVAETMWKNLQARIGSKLEHHIYEAHGVINKLDECFEPRQAHLTSWCFPILPVFPSASPLSGSVIHCLWKRFDFLMGKYRFINEMYVS